LESSLNNIGMRGLSKGIAQTQLIIIGIIIIIT